MHSALAWYGWWVESVRDVALSLPAPLAYYGTVPAVIFLGLLPPLVLPVYVACSPWIVREYLSRRGRRFRPPAHPDLTPGSSPRCGAPRAG